MTDTVYLPLSDRVRYRCASGLHGFMAENVPDALFLMIVRQIDGDGEPLALAFLFCCATCRAWMEAE